MEEGKRDWSTGFTRPYYKVFPFVKENIGKLGWLALIKLILMVIMYVVNMALQIIVRVGAYVIAFAIILGSIVLLSILIALGLSETTSAIIVAVVIILVLLAIILLFMALMIFIGSVQFGVEIYICRKILDIIKGEPLNLDIMKHELERDWKIYLKKGMRFYIVYMMVVFPILLIPILTVLLAVSIVIVILMLINVEFVFLFGPFMMYLFAFIIAFFIIIIVLLVNPFVVYISDWACLRMADGMGAWESIKEAISYIWKKWKLMKHFWIGYFLINLTSSFIYPLAMILSFILPLLSKIFLLVNDEEYG